jgi:hypothetical protein
VPVGTTPIDWGYVWGKFHDIYKLNGSAEMMRWVVYFVKGMQEHDNVKGLDRQTGWNPITVGVSIFVRPAMDAMWANVPGDQKSQILEALLGAWLDKCKQFPPSEYYSEGFASPTYIPVTKNGYDKTLGDRLWYMIPVFRHEGVDANLIEDTRRWAASLFPLAQW